MIVTQRCQIKQMRRGEGDSVMPDQAGGEVADVQAAAADIEEAADDSAMPDQSDSHVLMASGKGVTGSAAVQASARDDDKAAI